MPSAVPRQAPGGEPGPDPQDQPAPAPAAALGAALDTVAAVVGADAVLVYLLDPDTAALRVAAARGLGATATDALGVQVGEGGAGRVVAGGAPVLADATGAAGTGGPDPLAAALGPGPVCLLGVPLVSGTRRLGALVVGAAGDGALAAGDMPVLTLAASHVTLALDHAVLLGAERRARQVAETAMGRLERLQELTAALAGALTETEVVRIVISSGLRLLDAVAGAVWTASGDRLRLTGATGYPDAIISRLGEFALDAPYPTAVAARERRPVLLLSIADRDASFPGIAREPAVGDAFAALPLTFGSSLVGVLSASFTDGSRLADPAGVEFLEAVAGQCAVAMHRVAVLAAEREARRTEQEAVHRLGRLQSFTERLATAADLTELADATVATLAADLGTDRCVLALLDGEHRNLSVVRASGLAPGSVDRFGTMPLSHHLPATEAVVHSRPVVVHSIAERDRRYPRLAGLPPGHDHTLVVLPLLVEGDPVGSLSLSFPEVRRLGDDDLAFLLALAAQCGQAIERARLREGQRRSRRQLALLAETGRLFASSLVLDATLEQICRLLAPAVVDLASARVFDDQGKLRLAAYALADESLDEPLHRLWQAGGEANEQRMLGIIAAGEPVLEGPVTPGGAVLPPGTAADLETLDLRSSVLLPLRARGRAIGLVSVGTRSGRPPLTEADLPFLAELAARVALAVDNARLFHHQSEIARTLQHSLLPAALPAVEGAEVAVSYVPGMEGTTVGGDFYDVIPLPSGRVGLVIGDVMGRGVRAAALMGQLRASVRSYAFEGHGPAALLARLDRLVTTLEDGLLVTCVYGEWDPRRCVVTLSCAGHLPPLVRLPGEQPRFLDVDPGLPLGVGSLAATECEVELPPGALLLAYTDGIVESPSLPLADGMTALADAVAGAPSVASEVCRLVVERLGPAAARAPGPADGGARRHDDDVALLALIAVDGSGHAGSVQRSGGVVVELPADPGSPARARDTVADALHRWGMSAIGETAVLLVSELVTNAVRHAGTALRLQVSRPAPHRVRVEVLDHAPRAELRPRPSTASAEGGRGLFLVQALAAAWGSETVPAGKVVWYELEHRD